MNCRKYHNIRPFETDEHMISMEKVYNFNKDVCGMCARAQLCPTLHDPMDQTARLLCPWDIPAKNAGVGCHSSSRGSFPPRDLSNLHFLWLLNWQADSLRLGHLGSPRTWNEKCKMKHSVLITNLSNSVPLY